MEAIRRLRCAHARAYFGVLLLLAIAAGMAKAQGSSVPAAVTGDPISFGGTIANLNDAPFLNSQGQVAFRAGINDGSSAILRGGGSFGLSTMARTNQFVQNLGTLTSLDSPAINDSGQVAFAATFSDGSPQFAVFRYSDEQGLVTIARQGQAMGDLESTITGFDPINQSSVRINSNGQVAFFTGIAANQLGLNSAIAVGGFPNGPPDYVAPPVPVLRGLLGSYSPLSYNDLGQVAVSSSGAIILIDNPSATFLQPGNNVQFATPLNNSGQIVRFSSTAITRSDGIFPDVTIAQTGQAAPGGRTFSEFVDAAVMNDAGHVAFVAHLGDATHDGIYRGDGISMIKIAATTETTQFGGTFTSFVAPSLNINSIGVVAFKAKFSIAGGGSGEGIYLSDGIDHIAVQETDSGLFGITSLSMRGGATDSGHPALNDYGQVAYQATFQDGTQRISLFTPSLRFRGPSGGSWDDAANWTLGIKPASVHDVYIDPQGNLDVNGPTGEATVRSLTLGATSNGVATLRIPAGGSLRAGALTILPTGKLIVEGGATIHADFFDNQSSVNVNDVLVMDYDGGSPLSSIRAQIIKGYHNGTWTGDGITSAIAAANPSARAIGYAEAHDVLSPGATTFAGISVDSSSVLVRLTIPGDANLDGAVGFADLVAVAQHYGIADGHAIWSAGDFNYDGNIGFGDLVAVAQHYGGALAADVPGASAQFEADWAAAVASVPEPGSLPVFLGIAAAMAWRRAASKPAPAQPGQ